MFLHDLSPMGPINELQRCPSRVWSQGIYLPISPRVHAYEFLSRSRFSTPTPPQPMVELFVLTSSRFPLRKPEEKFTLAETRTPKFRLSGRTLYPLVHGGSPWPDVVIVVFFLVTIILFFLNLLPCPAYHETDWQPRAVCFLFVNMVGARSVNVMNTTL